MGVGCFHRISCSLSFVFAHSDMDNSASYPTSKVNSFSLTFVP
jgi:hypothetical protein